MWANVKYSCAKRAKAALVAVFFLVAPCWAQSDIVDEPPRSAQQETLAKVEQYLNNISTLVADFTQVAPNGELSGGTLYLQRPGKMRWEYRPPTPILIVSTGETLVYYDRETDEVSYISLDDTLAAFIARPEIDFADPALIVEDVAESDASLQLRLRQSDKEDARGLMIEFEKNPLKIKRLITISPDGQLTRILLDRLRFGVPIDADKFIFRRSIFDR